MAALYPTFTPEHFKEQPDLGTLYCSFLHFNVCVNCSCEDILQRVHRDWAEGLKRVTVFTLLSKWRLFKIGYKDVVRSQKINKLTTEKYFCLFLLQLLRQHMSKTAQ
jgi:hypothetical protein